MSVLVMQLGAIFAFGLVVSGIVCLGVLRAREYTARAQRAERAREPNGTQDSISSAQLVS